MKPDGQRLNLDSTLSEPATVETILRADDGNGTPEYRAWVASMRERRGTR